MLIEFSALDENLDPVDGTVIAQAESHDSILAVLEKQVRKQIAVKYTGDDLPVGALIRQPEESPRVPVFPLTLWHPHHNLLPRAMLLVQCSQGESVPSCFGSERAKLHQGFPGCPPRRQAVLERQSWAAGSMSPARLFSLTWDEVLSKDSTMRQAG